MPDLVERIASIREHIEWAARKSGRTADDITLVAVTKTFPVETVLEAREAGLVDFGENKPQELVAKAGVVPGRVQGGDVVWHAIGHLQRNKVKDVVRHADLFHALDSERLAAELDNRAGQVGRVIPCLVQVNVSGEDTKFGLEPESLSRLIESVRDLKNLSVKGLMTLASPVDDPEDVRPQFAHLRRLAETVGREQGIDLGILSMGMSGDFEVAIEEGATHIRIGSALFGSRV